MLGGSRTSLPRENRETLNFWIVRIPSVDSRNIVS